MLTALLSLALALGSGDPVPVRVDARVELVTLVFRLAGANEFDQPVSRSLYSQELEKWFGGARGHEVVQRARRLRQEHGIGFNAVPELAVHLTPLPELGLRLPLEPRPERLDARWQGADVDGFLKALRAFAAETRFSEFFASYQDLYHEAEARLAAKVEAAGVRAWLGEFFGVAAGTSFVAIPGLLCGGGNYGCSVRLADGTLELCPILGVGGWDDEDLPLFDESSVPLIVHEFTHAFSNPVVDAQWPLLAPSFERLFPAVRSVMERQAYGQPKIVAYESLVRACVIRHTARASGAEALRKLEQEEVANGFAWVPELAHLLESYEADRKTYPTLTAFAPRIAAFFEEVARRMAAQGAPAGSGKPGG